MAKYPKYHQQLNAAAAAAFSTQISNIKLTKYECGIHNLKYLAVQPGCPACLAEREASEAKRGMKELIGKLDIAYAQLADLRVQTDFLFAVREAVPLMNDEDLAFLKVVLYEWRDTKALAMKVTHGARLKKADRSRAPANGFIVMPRRGDPYGHACNSVGGLAVAEYFDEAINTLGSSKAMERLVSAMAPFLPGSLNS